MKEKKIELKNDKLMLEYALKEEERVKKLLVDKKQKVKEDSLKICEDNEKYKIIQKEQREKMVLEDKKFSEEYKLVLDQLEKNRNEYVKSRIRKANSIDPAVIVTLKKEQQDKLDAEDRELQNFKEQIDKR